MPVCGRCAGLYLSGTAALLLGLAARPFRGPLPRSRRAAAGWPATLQPSAAALAVAAVPTLVTWSLEMLDLWNPGTLLRAAAAVPLGAAVGWMLASPQTPPDGGRS